MRTSLLRSAACAAALSTIPAAGCDRLDAHPRSVDRRLAAHLTAVWDIALVRRRGPMGADTAEAHGTLSLLAYTQGDESPWLHRTITNTGAYEIDLTALGLPLHDITPVPSLVASAVSPDSLLVALLSSDGQGAVVLRGVALGDSVAGVWTYDARSAGGWSGDFVLTRHRQ